MKNKKSKWTFAHVSDLYSAFKLPNLHDLYKNSLNLRDSKREMYNRALNAALENLMSWERAARADGFDVICATDIFQGAPHPVYDNGEWRFVQAYGVQVVEGGGE
jgi:hypothetical protein